MIPPFTGDGRAVVFISAARALDPPAAWADDERSWCETTRDILNSLSCEINLRPTRAAVLHPFLLTATGQRCPGTAARSGRHPLRPIYQLLP
jgi:hypothetical protein